jgi:hypothetical protein
MNVENLSTNYFTFVAGFPDGTTQSVTLQPDSFVQVSRVIYGGTNYQDSFDTNYVIVNDSSTGFHAHSLVSPSGEFMQGFFDIAPLTAVLAVVWFVRRGLFHKTSGYTTD